MAKKKSNPSWWQYPDRSAFYGTWGSDHALIANHGSVKQVSNGWLSSPKGIDSKVFKTRQEAMHYVSDRVHPVKGKNPFAGYSDFKACVADQTAKGARSPGGLCRTIARKAGEMNPKNPSIGEHLRSAYDTAKHAVTKSSQRKKAIKRLQEAGAPPPAKKMSKAAQAVADRLNWDKKNPGKDQVYTDLAYGNEYKKIRGKWHARFSHRSPYYKGDTWRNIDGEHATIARMIASGKIVAAGSPSDGKLKSNPESSADSMYETFHGREPDETVIFEEEMHVHEHLAGLGDLTGLIFITSGKKPMEVELSEEDLKGCMLSCSEDGRQMYINGSVDIDLSKLNYEDPDIKDKVNLGEACVVVYRTAKDFDHYEMLDYEHHIGKREKWRNDPIINKHVGQRPILAYEPRTGALSFIGGQYLIDRAGILN